MSRILYKTPGPAQLHVRKQTRHVRDAIPSSVSNAVHYLHDELKGDSNNWDPDGRSGDASSEGVEDEDEENNDNPPNFLGRGKDPAVDVGGNEPSSPSLVGLNIIDIGEDSEDTDWEVSSKLESSNSPRDCCEYDSNGSE